MSQNEQSHLEKGIHHQSDSVLHTFMAPFDFVKMNIHVWDASEQTITPVCRRMKIKESETPQNEILTHYSRHDVCVCLKALARASTCSKCLSMNPRVSEKPQNEQSHSSQCLRIDFHAF